MPRASFSSEKSCFVVARRSLGGLKKPGQSQRQRQGNADPYGSDLNTRDAMKQRSKMPQQLSFASHEFAQKKKAKRKEEREVSGGDGAGGAREPVGRSHRAGVSNGAARPSTPSQWI